ncbi:ATP-dependent DNA helicase [Lutispora thermophila]|uniref:Rad3-related DNA helicase n=1 Tax=Lutispora thermophila DSM 19022 TaxID=1122184 RepID=A0A1M6H473_9FIRM|nr:ATP-dependent DNA helicase [Lutispora thermophila]SHJ16946.1 Rad3-related DNA helicase [Lutispora thermophila DSM 19022]
MKDEKTERTGTPMVLKMSIRSLVEFIFRSGNIDSGFMSISRALEGSKAHRRMQKSYGDDYKAEVPLKKNIEFEGYSLVLEGRADGIFIEDGNVIIDEIKSVTQPLELIDEDYDLRHWAQAKCYGYIYGEENALDNITIQLTYIHLETDEVKKFRKSFHILELKSFFYDLVEKYCKWADLTISWISARDDSIKKLKFPFPQYRKGQREMAAAVYRAIRDENILFAQAPTGIGKTISTLFPAVKAMGEGLTSKIFYLTAKTTTQMVAEEAFQRMKDMGLKFISITITAKDKICFKEERQCTPGYCEYAKGHFDRVNDAIMDILQNEKEIDREKILAYAKKHRVCPFEYSLDIALWADCVICDYNYLFDPNASLKRFFMDKKTDFTFLIDEAHNLVDRAREMYSAELYKKDFLELKKLMKGKNKELQTSCNSINKYFLELKKELGEEYHHVSKGEYKDLYQLLNSFVAKADKYLSTNEEAHRNEQLMSVYFAAINFLRISENYDEHYVTYMEKHVNNIRLKLFCHDPSVLISQILKKGKAAVFFSATLLPIDYFHEILGGGENSKSIYLRSPFDPANRCLLIGDDIATRYSKRDDSYGKIADYIHKVVKVRTGNYMVFFPSYKYMESVYEEFTAKYNDYSVNMQMSGATEEEKALFIETFQPNPKNTNIGFCVLGGVFSEGIDLRDDRLIGVIVVGVGLPQLCLERDIIKNYYDNKNQKGFEYSYMYPGMNKVMQAAGRLIRSETDRGVILLLDERFARWDYQRLFPKEWFPYTRVNEKTIDKVLEGFWS